MKWKPISELEDKYSNNLLLCAPELVDLDCNEVGIGMGYWQDGYHEPCNEHGACGDPDVDYGAFVCCKWSMSNDEWYEQACTPTHFIILKGPKPTKEGGVSIDLDVKIGIGMLILAVVALVVAALAVSLAT